MWKREKNHLVWTEGFGRSSIPKAIRSSPWVFVQLPGQEIVYMQLEPEKEVHKRPGLRMRDVMWLIRWVSRLKSLAIL